MKWAGEEDNLLTELWNRGESATQIGIAMGKSRNAIIGRKHRLGLSARKAVAAPCKKAPRRPVLPPKPASKPKAPEVIPISGGVHILDLQEHHCRAVTGYGEDGLAVYCGAQKATEGSSYRDSWCVGHKHLYLQPPRLR